MTTSESGPQAVRPRTPIVGHAPLRGRDLPPEATVGAPKAATGILKHAAGLLRGQASLLAERALSRIRAEAAHTHPVLAPADCGDLVHRAMEIAVESLADPERFLESGEFAWNLGQRRAAEGIPMLPLLQAYRVGAAVLWEGLVAAALEDAPGQAQAVVFAASDFWRFVARDTTLLMEAHRRTLAGLAPDDGRKLLPALKALLRGNADPLDVSTTAIAFDLPIGGRYAVARLEGPGAVRGPDAAVREEAAGIRLHWCPQGEAGQVVVALLEERPVADLLAVLAAGRGVRGGVSPVVEGLGEVARAKELAELALGTARHEGEVVLLDDRLAAGLVAARPDLAAGIAAKVLGPVLELEPADRASLLDTLEAWLDCVGSTDRAGERLYCHRNTVLNRLRRLERLTGRTLDRPRDLVDLALALEACRLGTAG
ncbi:PucR family transcriptional regulator [Kitasatospora phosalacinea]|uniref:PucR family transcriptional regulator n=1 Tax=Kitasatospora phosalacinea TaxID=2065 RepID=A0ABW6GVZ5_9ACTN